MLRKPSILIGFHSKQAAPTINKAQRILTDLEPDFFPGQYNQPEPGEIILHIDCYLAAKR